MLKPFNKSIFTVGLLVLFMAVPAFGASVNKSVKIQPGESADGASSVNGSITVGADATVSGDVSTVNGSIRVDSGARIRDASTVNGGLRIADNVTSQDLSTVNGTIRVGEGTVVDGEVEAVNGRIELSQGARIDDDVGNVNGEIEIVGAEVGGDVSTVSGDVSVVEGSVVRGDLIVEKPGGWGWGKEKRRKPTIIIGPGATVAGTIKLEREVKLYISDSASVGGVEGKMSMDDAVRFSGDKP